MDERGMVQGIAEEIQRFGAKGCGARQPHDHGSLFLIPISATSEGLFGNNAPSIQLHLNMDPVYSIQMVISELLKMDRRTDFLSKKPSARIENVVASVIMNQTFDLDAILGSVPGAEYNPEKFPGLVYRISKPHTATLIFSTGKMVCTGAKSVKEVHAAVKKIVSNLKERKIVIIGAPEITIQNIVASGNLHAEVNLEKAAFLLENVMYEPEQFPGLIYRMDVPKVVLLIFSSGRMVCTGAKHEDEVQTAAERIGQKLTALGVLYE